MRGLPRERVRFRRSITGYAPSQPVEAIHGSKDTFYIKIDKHWDPAWKEYGTIDGTFYAAPLGAPAALSLAGLIGLAAERVGDVPHPVFRRHLDPHQSVEDVLAFPGPEAQGPLAHRRQAPGLGRVHRRAVPGREAEEPLEIPAVEWQGGVALGDRDHPWITGPNRAFGQDAVDHQPAVGPAAVALAQVELERPARPVEGAGGVGEAAQPRRLSAGAFQRGAIPLAGVCARLIRRLQELKKCRLQKPGLSHGFIRKNELSHFGVVARFLRLDSRFSVARGLGVSVAVEDRLIDAVQTAWPEP